jgi:hypothetical protein
MTSRRLVLPTVDHRVATFFGRAERGGMATRCGRASCPIYVQFLIRVTFFCFNKSYFNHSGFNKTAVQDRLFWHLFSILSADSAGRVHSIYLFVHVMPLYSVCRPFVTPAKTTCVSVDGNGTSSRRYPAPNRYSDSRDVNDGSGEGCSARRFASRISPPVDVRVSGTV